MADQTILPETEFKPGDRVLIDKEWDGAEQDREAIYLGPSTEVFGNNGPTGYAAIFELDGGGLCRKPLDRIRLKQSKDVLANNRDAAMTPPILGGDHGVEPSSIPAQRTSPRAEAGTSAGPSFEDAMNAVLDYARASVEAATRFATAQEYNELSAAASHAYVNAFDLIKVAFLTSQALRPVSVADIAIANAPAFGCEEHGYFYAGVRWRESLNG